MTFQSAQQQLLAILAPIYDAREANAIAHMIMEHLTGKTKIERLLEPASVLTAKEESLLQSYIDQLSRHRPVQYVLGEAWFAGMQFHVNEHVLIPRPETEELVTWIIDEAVQDAQQILDIGTGSGCIPITLKKSLPAASITSIDIDPNALQVAHDNATTLQADIQLIELDFLNESLWHKLPGDYDTIVSNPPYIKAMESNTMAKHVLDYEPARALFVPDDDALVFYRKIAAFASTHLNKAGSIYMEINEALGKEVKQLFGATGYHVTIKQDLQGKDRMIKASKAYYLPPSQA
ncbi:peptide chain release factor N(5)-glutamine methyltransferase [Asinibacterium sp. OR53]|uniref:peptide chain release factor N(5)-glutamine methyltransferase n=1 Tax=Asinibacterium sp. OR53 TaxID=925409 RepID=UPI0004B9DFEA|nr:peptide chain release factor N(5)-glutamine methyltransferase [Asinibacterium sp. OR53]